MFRIKRFNVIKTSTVVAVMYMVIVAVVVVPVLLIFGIAATASVGAETGLAAVLGIGVFAIFGYGLLGWVFTAIACLIYNLVAGWVGGVEIELELVDPPAPPPAWIAPTAPPAQPPTAPPTDPMVRAV